MDVTYRFVETNGIRMHVAEAGSGRPVVLCHGFPESWYSWRHQLQALAQQGYRAIAPDMRGFGQTDKPPEIDQYTLFHLTGDIVGLLDALAVEQAAVVGHDWGAPVALYSALFRPDRFLGVATLSVPFRPRLPARPLAVMPRTETSQFYWLYFQQPGKAEAEFERNVERTVRLFLLGGAGDAAAHIKIGPMVPTAGTFLGDKAAPDTLPAWLSEADVAFYTGEFTRSGFRGGLNWYRNIDRNWELLAPWKDAKLAVPALYIVGDRDLVYQFPGMEALIANLSNVVPKLTKTVVLPGCGHWTQQERPGEVSTETIQFLDGLDWGAGYP